MPGKYSTCNIDSVTNADEVVAKLLHCGSRSGRLDGLRVVCDEEGQGGLDNDDACLALKAVSSVSIPVQYETITTRTEGL